MAELYYHDIENLSHEFRNAFYVLEYTYIFPFVFFLIIIEVLSLEITRIDLLCKWLIPLFLLRLWNNLTRGQ